MKAWILLIFILTALFPLSSSFAGDAGLETYAVEATKKGWRYFRIGDQATALKRFRQAIILDPDHAPGYYGVAYLCSLQDRLSLAVQDYRKCVELPSARHRCLEQPGSGPAEAGERRGRPADAAEGPDQQKKNSLTAIIQASGA